MADDINGVEIGDLVGLLNATLPAVRKGRLEVAFARKSYEVVNRWHAPANVEETSGDYIEQPCMLDDSGNARFVLPFEADNPSLKDHTHMMRVDWKTANTFYGWERKELLMNAGVEQQLYNLERTRRIDGLIGLANLIEDNGWQDPDVADPRIPWGIKYWFPPLADGQNTQGWYGGCPTGFTTVANISPCSSGGGTTAITGGQANWRSYCGGGTDVYTDVDETLDKSLSMMFVSLQWEVPQFIEELREGPLSLQRIYVNLRTHAAWEQYLRLNDDLAGPGSASFNGAPAVKRIPLKYITHLDADTRDPWYFVNHAHFATRVLRGDNMRESRATTAPWQHNVAIVYFDHTYNYLCVNRKYGGGVLRKTA